MRVEQLLKPHFVIQRKRQRRVGPFPAHHDSLDAASLPLNVNEPHGSPPRLALPGDNGGIQRLLYPGDNFAIGAPGCCSSGYGLSIKRHCAPRLYVTGSTDPRRQILTEVSRTATIRNEEVP
jgi:hypothetical protein